MKSQFLTETNEFQYGMSSRLIGCCSYKSLFCLIQTISCNSLLCRYDLTDGVVMEWGVEATSPEIDYHGLFLPVLKTVWMSNVSIAYCWCHVNSVVCHSLEQICLRQLKGCMKLITTRISPVHPPGHQLEVITCEIG